MDLADQPLEYGGGSAHNAIVSNCGPILAAFTSKFAPVALEDMTRDCSEMGYEYKSGVQSFAEEASGVKDRADFVAGHSTPDPIKHLIASAYGTAIGAVMRCGLSLAPADEQHARLLLRNSSKTIAGCLAQIEADAEASRARFLVAFKTGLAIAGAATAGAVGVALAAMSPSAEQLFVMCSTGQVSKHRHHMIDRFNDGMNTMVYRLNLTPDKVATFKNTFHLALQYL